MTTTYGGLAALALAVNILTSGCTDECTFTTSRPVTVTPETSCLSASIAAPYSNQSIASCEAPTLVIYNNCGEAVVVSGEATADGSDFQIDPAAFGEILVRMDLGSLIGPGLTQFVVPAAIGGAAISIAFVLVKEERSHSGGGDDDDD